MTKAQRGLNLRRLGASLLFCAILLSVLMYAGGVLKPSRSLLRGEAGAAWGGYLIQPRDTIDVIFIGNSHVFCGVDPAVLWSSRGISSYVMAGPVQSLQVGRRYVAEALRTQKPRVIAIDLSLLTYNQRNYVTEFQLINVGYMPLGANKVLAAVVDTPKTDRTAALVGLWAYHGRWAKLKPSDFNLSESAPNDAFLKGFSFTGKSRPVTATAPVPEKVEKPSIIAAEARNMKLLREIAVLCERNDIELLLFLTPTAPPGAYSGQLRRAAAELSREFDNVSQLDLSRPRAVTGLSYETDFFDGGHLATPGAEKASRVLANHLAETYGMQDHRGDPAYAQWDDDVRKHDAQVAKYWGEAPATP